MPPTNSRVPLLLSLFHMGKVVHAVAPDSLARDWAIVAIARAGEELLSDDIDEREAERHALGVLADCAEFFDGETAKEAQRLLDELI